MRIDIWSDVVCPWCYIGKRRLEAALADFEHADAVEVVFHSFELDPDAPRNGTEPTVTSLERKYGPGARQMMQQVTEVAAGDGLAFRLEETVHGSTADAHRLLHAALADGGPTLQGTVKEAFLAANFLHGRNLSDPEVLREVAVEAGLAPERVEAGLDGTAFADEVAADVDRARALGASGVPFTVVDGRYGVSGAQPTEVFAQALAQAWQDRAPEVPVVVGGATADAGACDDSGCALPGPR